MKIIFMLFTSTDNSEKLFNYFNVFTLNAELCWCCPPAGGAPARHRLPASCFSRWLLNTAPVAAGGTAAALNP